MSVYLETEHQELFALKADLTRPVPVHVPSALGPLGYFVCLRVPSSQVDGLTQVKARMQVGGLRPDDVHSEWGEGLGDVAATSLSKVDGLTWVFVCRVQVSRGDGEVILEDLPVGLTEADVLLCTWPRIVHSGQADDWIACQEDPAWASGGIPLGGIGTGKVELCRDGRFRNFSGNNNQDMPFEEPDGLDGAYLSVRLGDTERVLATRPASWLEPVRTLEAEQRFPQVVLGAPEAFRDIDVEVTATAPFVPHDLRLSTLPGLLLRWRLTNRTTAPQMVTCRLAWPNLVGQGGGIGLEETRIGYADGAYRFWDAPDGPSADCVAGDGFTALRYGNEPSPVCASADGFHYVAVMGESGVLVEADPVRGSVSRSVQIPPDESVAVEMAMAWEMPHWIDTLEEDRGQYWQNHCEGGMDVLARLFAESGRIWQESSALYRVLERTDLPSFITSRLQNCCYPLATNSVFYRDGRFSINEGPTEMAGCYGTLDQRLGGHAATLLFFPELNRRELAQFAACQSPNGGMNHDLGGGHLDRGPAESAWPDLTCSFILQLARHSWSLGDHAFAATFWPQARAGLLRHREWSDAGGGVAQVGSSGLGTSYDGYHYEGTTPYMGTLWIAALRVAGEWARRVGDTEIAALSERLSEVAAARMEEDLWNGRYYRAYGSPDGPQNDNCHAGMLAGEFYARTLANTSVAPTERVASCLQALVELNGSDRFAIPPDEASPNGEEHTEYGWLPYVESFGLTALALHGREGTLDMWERVLQSMDGSGKHPCDTRLMYQPVSGLPSWGSYYMTAPASWLVYEAMLNFSYRPAEQVLRLSPMLAGRFAIVHPLFWGVGERQGELIRVKVERVFGGAVLAVSQLEVLASSGEVRANGAALTRVQTRGEYAWLALPEPVHLQPGVELEWTVLGA